VLLGHDLDFAANPELKRQEQLASAEARQFFRSHDIVHVLYST